MRVFPVIVVMAVFGLAAACSYDWEITAAPENGADGGITSDASDASTPPPPPAEAGPTCSKASGSCKAESDCCSGLHCAANDRCMNACSALAGECGGLLGGKQCCLGMNCEGATLLGPGKCVACDGGICP